MTVIYRLKVKYPLHFFISYIYMFNPLHSSRNQELYEAVIKVATMEHTYDFC